MLKQTCVNFFHMMIIQICDLKREKESDTFQYDSNPKNRFF